MRKIKNRLFVLIIMILVLFVLAIDDLKLQANTNNNEIHIGLKDFSEEYIRYLELSDEEKENVYAPRMFDIKSSSFVPNNQLKIIRSAAVANLEKYSLKDTISENIEIRNQENTNMCWTFASLSSLETNLALADKNNGRLLKVYDFSERHMEYATVRDFNGQTNIFGFNREINSGAKGINKFDIAYLTNGMGAINEIDMPFNPDDMSMEDKHLSYIQNKEIQTQVYDIVDFQSTKTDELISKMKNHIKNYGSINVTIHGASPDQEYVEKDGQKYYCYNNATGAIYCNNSTIFPNNHAVSLIGWDDEYAISNFNSNNRPSKPGAWIVRNSWGTNGEKFSYENMKVGMYNYYNNSATRAELEQILENTNLNWTSVNSVTNDQVDKFAAAIGWVKDSDGQFYLKVGDDGIMYISYEDCNVYSYMTGVEKAENKVSYNNLYQYDELGNTTSLFMKNPNNENAWIGNVFDKETNGTEYLTQVSIYAPEKYTCKVWVNPNGASKEKKNLRQAKLKEGDTETFEAGYHTIEFAEPIEINANQFFVALEVKVYNTDKEVSLAVEGLWDRESLLQFGIQSVPWDCVKVESGKTFVNMNGVQNFDNAWLDLSEVNVENMYGGRINGADSTLKAFTTNSLESIRVTNPPNRRKYVEGESFDKTGMVVTAYLDNGNSFEVEDYTITDGEKLIEGQETVTIQYMQKTTTQSIEVTKNTGGVEENLPENSDFSNAIAKNKLMKIYTYKNNSDKNYVLINVEMSGIKKATVNDNLSYAYYLSSNQQEGTIPESSWTKLTGVQINNGALSFTINTKDIPNYDEVSKANNLYLYVKETATRNGENKILVVNAKDISKPEQKEEYIDGIKQGGSSGGLPVGDGSIASGKYPYTGKIIIAFACFIVIVIGMVGFIKYKNIDK